MRMPGGDPTRNFGLWVAALLAAGVGLSGCTADSTGDTGDQGHGPAVVESVEGTDTKRVTLTDRAARRVGISEVAVAAATGTDAATADPAATVVPYSAVLYDPDGITWVYTVRQPLTYVREKVSIATVGGEEGTQAILSAGPEVGTRIVSSGVIELWGTELGVGE